LQRSLLAHVNRVRQTHERHSRICSSRGIVSSSELEDAKSSYGQPLHELGMSCDYNWGLSAEIAAELTYTQPQFIATSSSSTPLKQELGVAHAGRILMAPEVTRVEQVDNLAAAVEAVITGGALTGNAGGFCTSVRGNVVATVTSSIRKALHGGQCTAVWPHRCLWLMTEFKINRELPEVAGRFPLAQNFRQALEAVLNRRLYLQRAKPGWRNEDPRIQMFNRLFVKSLRKSPHADAEYGEYCAPLFATLWRGLKLLAAHGNPAPELINAKAITELSALIARRSWQEVHLVRKNSEDAQLRQLALKIYHKLGDEPITLRTLVRGLHHVDYASCRGALGLLEQLNLASCAADKWTILPAEANVTNLILKSPAPPTINV
jgi:hypothetical protein